MSHRIRQSCRRISVPVLAALLLTACGGGADTTPTTGATTTNAAPLISGSPATTVVVGSAYTFSPVATDADRDTLSFSIANRPSWATFSVSTGQLSGTPAATHVGTYSNITVTVSDGTSTATLGPFTIVVQAAPSANATLTWSAPTENTDGSALTNLSGYWIYRGPSAVELDRIQQVQGATTTTVVIQNLPSGTHYFAVAAVTTSGIESPLSNVVRRTIP